MKRNWRPGNRVDLLENGEAYYPRVFECIAQARHEVVIETFILFEDKVGVELRRHLIDAATRGVKVALTIDGWGSPDLSREFIDGLTQAGVALHIFDPAPKLWRRLSLFRRLHRKIVVVDGQIAFIGGINFSADHLGDFGPEAKQDYAVELHGPIVEDIHRFALRAIRPARSFGGAWPWRAGDAAGQPPAHGGSPDRDEAARSAGDALPPPDQPQGAIAAGHAGQASGPAHQAGGIALSQAPRPGARHWWQRRAAAPAPATQPHAGSAQALLVTRDNRRHLDDIERQYRLAIRAARREVVIANAYFFPGLRLLRDLRAAARRGVQVKLILQGQPDMAIVTFGARMLYPYLLDAGVQIFEYCRRPLHGKVALADDEWATVGSSNLDPLSLSLNLEANVILLDRGFNQHLRERLQALMQEHCREIHPADAPKRGGVRLVLSVIAFHLLRRFPRWAQLLPEHKPLVKPVRAATVEAVDEPAGEAAGEASGQPAGSATDLAAAAAPRGSDRPAAPSASASTGASAAAGAAASASNSAATPPTSTAARAAAASADAALGRHAA